MFASSSSSSSNKKKALLSHPDKRAEYDGRKLIDEERLKPLSSAAQKPLLQRIIFLSLFLFFFEASMTKLLAETPAQQVVQGIWPLARVQCAFCHSRQPSLLVSVPVGFPFFFTLTTRTTRPAVAAAAAAAANGSTTTGSSSNTSRSSSCGSCSGNSSNGRNGSSSNSISGRFFHDWPKAGALCGPVIFPLLV